MSEKVPPTDPDRKGEQTPPPDPEKLWDRRWTSHLYSLAFTGAYLIAVVFTDAPWNALWPLVALNMAHYGPAFMEQLAKLRRP